MGSVCLRCKSLFKACHLYYPILALFISNLLPQPEKTSLRHYPAYHTSLDNMQYMVRFIDPTFRAHATLARTIGEMTLRLSTLAKLPMDVRELAATLEEEYNGLYSIFHTKNTPILSNLGRMINVRPRLMIPYHNASLHCIMMKVSPYLYDHCVLYVSRASFVQHKQFYYSCVSFPFQLYQTEHHRVS